MGKFDYGWEVVEPTKFKRTTVVLDASVYAFLSHWAVVYDLTVSDIINLIVSDFMAEYERISHESGQEI